MQEFKCEDLLHQPPLIKNKITMKKIMLSMAAIAVILVSCEKDENYSTAPGDLK
jgi:hypothetical protein